VRRVNERKRRGLMCMCICTERKDKIGEEREQLKYYDLLTFSNLLLTHTHTHWKKII